MTDIYRDAMLVVYDRRKTDDILYPTMLATEALVYLAPSHPKEVVYGGCHRYLTALASRILAHSTQSKRRSEMVDTQAGQLSLLPILQNHYPQKRQQSDRSSYIKKHLLNEEDLLMNVDRLKKVSESTSSHAEALLAYGIMMGIVKRKP